MDPPGQPPSNLTRGTEPATRARAFGICAACGHEVRRAVVRCPSCGLPAIEPAPEPEAARSLADYREARIRRVATGHVALDAALSGGLATGATVLLWGRPGSGKSTLAYSWAGRAALALGGRAYIVCPEMGPALMRATAERTGAPLALLVPWSARAAEAPDDAAAIVVDSLPTVEEPMADLLALVARVSRSPAIGIVIVHATKLGLRGGPERWAHWADTVIGFTRRWFRLSKDRFSALAPANVAR